MYDVFSLPSFKFPKNFLWGSATAGHQVEGDNIHSQRWEAEQKGKAGVPSGKACNHYKLYKEDIKLIQELGHQAYRLSIEWSRIEPEQGRFNQKAVAHYLDLLDGLQKAGIKIFATLHHFTHPLWFEKKSGFTKIENIKYFEKYLDFIIPKISPYVHAWITINEFNMGTKLNEFEYKINMLKFHAKAYHIIKQYSKAPVSTAHAFMHLYPARYFDRFDNVMTDYADLIINEFFFHAIRTGEIILPWQDSQYVPELKDTADYWGVNYYTRFMIDSRIKEFTGKRITHKALKMIKQDFFLEEMFPEGLTNILVRLKDKPVIITENGCCCDNDDFRIVYIALYLSAIKDALDQGVKIPAYLYWSLMDNYEWGSFVPRFGLVKVDFKTFKRTPKPSANFYRDIIKENGFSQKILRKYLKQLPTLKK